MPYSIYTRAHVCAPHHNQYVTVYILLTELVIWRPPRLGTNSSDLGTSALGTINSESGT